MISLILLVTFQRGLVVISFKLNQDAIEKEFCENKSKPKLNCHGQCHLKKELQNTADDNLEKISVYKTVEMIIPEEVYSFNFERPLFKETKKVSYYKEQFTLQNFIKENFRPPVSVI